MDITQVSNDSLVEKTIELAFMFAHDPLQATDDNLKVGVAEIKRRLQGSCTCKEGEACSNCK